MNIPSPKDRLQRLEKFLETDPQNPALLADAFETAMAAGELERAESLLQRGLATGTDASTWKFRQANLLIGQKRLDEAWSLLLDLQKDAGPHPAIARNLAYIAFQRQRYAECTDLLRPVVDVAADAQPLDPTLQAMWLRALHQQHLLDEAVAWGAKQLAAGTLAPVAAGVASLVHVDSGNFESALQLSEQALQREPNQMEALVARATVALAQRNAEGARALLERALTLNPHDGRTWSALGFAEMLSANIEQAIRNFRQALTTMPEHIGTWHGLGWACFMLKDVDGARQAFEQALQLDRNFGESHGALAAVQATAGDRAAALESIERAKRLDPTNLSARYAESILSGEASDAKALQRLAHRVLGGRKAPFGEGTMADWLPPSAD